MDFLTFSTRDYGMKVFVYYEVVGFGIEFIKSDLHNFLKSS